jgi:hypothetical protein
MIVVPAPITGEYHIDGHVRRAGVYAISGHRVTLRQAIASAGGLEKGISDPDIGIIRRINDNQKNVIKVRYSELMSGKVEDPSLAPNDIVFVGGLQAPATTRAGVPATTQAASPQLRFFRIVIGRESNFHDGKRISWAAFKRMLDAIPPPQRKQIVLETAAASPELTVKSYNEAKWYANHLVQLYGMAYFSDTGIDPTPELPLTPDERRQDAQQQVDDPTAQRDKLVASGGDPQFIQQLDHRIAAIREISKGYGGLPRAATTTFTTPAPMRPATQPGAELQMLQEQRRKTAAAAERLAATLGSAHPQRRQLQGMLQALDAKIVALSRTPTATDLPQGQASPQLIRLLSMRAQLEEQIAYLSQSLGATHPVLKSTARQLKAVNKKIDDIVGIPMI